MKGLVIDVVAGEIAVELQNLAGGVHQQIARVGQRQLGGTGEQLYVQFPFHVADMVGKGLLRDVQPLGCPGDVQLLGYH